MVTLKLVKDAPKILSGITKPMSVWVVQLVNKLIKTQENVIKELLESTKLVLHHPSFYLMVCLELNFKISMTPTNKNIQTSKTVLQKSPILMDFNASNALLPVLCSACSPNYVLHALPTRYTTSRIDTAIVVNSWRRPRQLQTRCTVPSSDEFIRLYLWIVTR
jgi:hypothetical protein